ncbi:phage coat protein [Escherichia coli]|uniref:phage coat protein n=1 Tax=Escherichia coli TaxID=562 RepID=UPI000DFBBF38|nr:phage coat protein [Escherichia coli]STK85385.1 Phage Coat Protein A [Escherichia coli]STL11962.1 Phage Coat Protein A [Escherichia coli]STL11973.1 Phage Coat Protein A [Escherichia coli]HAI2189940.1 phage coat protein [Escherichia coli]
MRLLFLLLFLPFFSSAESFTRTFAPFKLTEADETCISRPALQGVTLSGAFRSDNTWYAVLDGCIYEATGVIVGSETGGVAADWIPVAAYEPSDGGDGNGNGDNSSGGGNDNTVSGRVSATYLLQLADALKEKECSSPTMICGSFSFASEPEEVMKLSDVRAFAGYYSCIPNGSGWQSLYKSTCYLREGYKIEDGKIVPDNGNEDDNNGSEDNNSGSEGGNNSGGGNTGSDGNDNNTGNGDDGLSDEWGRKIYYLLNAGLPAIGDKIDSFHHSFITQSGITSDYLAAIDEKLGMLTAQDDNYAESQTQFNSTMQGIIENGISSVEQGVQDRIQELIPLIEDYVPVLNFSGIIPQGFFGNNRDVCVPLDLSFSFRPFGGEEMPFNLSTEGVCRIYDGYLREVIRFFIYVITAVSLVILVDKSLSGR